MSWPVEGKPSARISVSTYRVEWKAVVTGASCRQVGTLKWSLSLWVISTASSRGTVSGVIGKSIITGMSNPPSSGSIIMVMPRALIRNPAMPSHRSSVPSCGAKASAPKGCVCGARACCFIDLVASVGLGLELVLGHGHRGHGLGPAGGEGEVGDGLDELFFGEAVLPGEGEVEVQLVDVAAGDEGGDGGEAPVALG